MLSPADAAIACSMPGVAGIIVSNHGGRQLDFSPTALDVLPAVLEAVRGRMPVLVDGGVRRGTDVFKVRGGGWEGSHRLAFHLPDISQADQALALGAQAVLLGRPVLYGLAAGGEQGVARILGILRDELERAMSLAGCSSVSEIGPGYLMPRTTLLARL